MKTNAVMLVLSLVFVWSVLTVVGVAYLNTGLLGLAALPYAAFVAWKIAEFTDTW